MISLQSIVLWIHPAHLPRLIPQHWSKSMQERNTRDREKEGQDALRGESPCPSVGCLPRRNKKLRRYPALASGNKGNKRVDGRFESGEEGEGAYGIDKGAQVEENGVECDDGHRLEGIAVNYVCCNNGVADLDAGRNWYGMVSY